MAASPASSCAKRYGASSGATSTSPAALARSVRPAEKDVFDIWSLIMQPDQPPASEKDVFDIWSLIMQPDQPPASLHAGVGLQYNLHASFPLAAHQAPRTEPACNHSEIVAHQAPPTEPACNHSEIVAHQAPPTEPACNHSEIVAHQAPPTEPACINHSEISVDDDNIIVIADGVLNDKYDAASASEPESASTCSSQAQYSSKLGQMVDDDHASQEHKMNDDIEHGPECRNEQENHARFGAYYKESAGEYCHCNHNVGEDQKKSSSQRVAAIGQPPQKCLQKPRSPPTLLPASLRAQRKHLQLIWCLVCLTQ
ncbi:hypothetical protein GOP47_0010147 [Adiantum capillus-veneris]|uniref:Uncharacterized protein n=1 Tax=Adiantum capillus-veneris TaxID=13818 RepID=A0A9D4ZIH8_ADICA|nr:hypothetical protein GOP47_0010147 [Adiantum capillus-veneris]